MRPLNNPLPEQEKKLWFKAKIYGYGWYPATWQGWAIIAIYVALVIFSAWDILRGASSGAPAVKRFILTLFALSIFLVSLCYKHGEKPRWRSGTSDNNHDAED